ncbi:MAG: hypothetical protein WCK67_06250 [bacterium]
MKLLISLLKFLQALCLLLIPILIVYCVFAATQTTIINQYKNELGTLLSPISTVVYFFNLTLGPLVSLFKGLVNFELTYNSTKLDFTHFVAAAALFVLYHVLGLTNNVLNFFSKKSDDLKKMTAKRRAEELYEKRMLEEVSKYKTYTSTVIILKLKKITGATNYLLQAESINENLMNSSNLVDEIIELVQLHSGVRCANLEKNGDIYIVFNDILKVVKFSKSLKEKVKELNKNLSKTGSGLSYYMFADNFPDVERSKKFAIIEKLFYLTGENEFFVGESFKKYYECFTKDVKCNFLSKGLYSLNDEHQVEIFELIGF